jgi:hypothetical protein
MRDDEFQALQAAKKAKKAAKKRKAEGGDDASTSQAYEGGDPPATAEWAVAEAPEPERRGRAAAEPTPSAFEDETRTCVDCGSDFVFAAAEQRWFHEKGYDAATRTRCPECTRAKKARFGEKAGPGTAAAERLSKTTCYTCGKSGHKGKDCPEAPRDNSAGGGVCFKFQSGSCTRGDSCRFAHVLENS